jgi:hypothetical protein
MKTAIFDDTERWDDDSKMNFREMDQTGSSSCLSADFDISGFAYVVMGTSRMFAELLDPNEVKIWRLPFGH